MEFNEVTLYDIKDNSLIKKIINEEDIECKYTIPLIFLLFNELFGKTKFKFDNNYLMLPSHYYNPYDNYKLCFYNNYNELFEFYISNDTEIVKYLKYALFPNNELLNIKLWTSKNLNELRYIIKKKILYNKFKYQKNMDYFLDGKEDKYIIYATSENDVEYFSEQFYENYNDYNFYGQNFYQKNFFKYKNKFECI